MTAKPIVSDEDRLEYLKMLMIWSADIQMALSAITFLGEVDQEQKYSKAELRRFRCYETAFIVAYSRPFTRANGTKFARLVMSDIGLVLSDRESEMHQRIRQLRDKVFAHSDTDFAHVRLDSYEIDLDEESVIFPRLQSDEGLVFSQLKDRLDAVELCSKVFHAVYKKLMHLDRERKERSPIYIRPGRQDRSTDDR